jgi:hypothetical protein
MTAEISAHIYSPIVIGLMIGGGLSAVITWRGMKPSRVTRELNLEDERVAEGYRRRAMSRVAAIYALIAFFCLAIALVTGGPGFMALSGINAVIGAFAVVWSRQARVSDYELGLWQELRSKATELRGGPQSQWLLRLRLLLGGLCLVSTFVWSIRGDLFNAAIAFFAALVMTGGFILERETGGR